MSMQLKLVAALSLVLLALVLWRGISKRADNVHSKVNWDDLLLGDDGRMSKAAFVMLGAFAVTTWMMVLLTVRDKMTEGYLAIYVGAWITPTVTSLITRRPSDPPVAVEETRTTQTTKTITPTGG